MNVRIFGIWVHTDMELMKKIYKSYSDIVFPSTCVCCGTSTSRGETFICSFCRTDKFENVPQNHEFILPNSVKFVDTMWYFDKGGYLQDLLHTLKYHFLRGVGIELGYLAGKYFFHTKSREQLEDISSQNPILIPIPLHPNKKKKRGYNQARALAEGVSNSTGFELIESGVVKRIKKTKTQTGLNLKQRSENLKDAFQITNPDLLENRLPIIVDDVFTTGATTFELAGTLFNVNGVSAGILSVAKA